MVWLDTVSVKLLLLLTTIKLLTSSAVLHFVFQHLTDAGLKPNRVFFLDLPEDCVTERLCYRLTDPVSGERFVACANVFICACMYVFVCLIVFNYFHIKIILFTLQDNLE